MKNRELLISKYKVELEKRKLPLIIHLAKFHAKESEKEEIRFTDNDLPCCLVRYKSNQYISGNKFFKPISRILNV